MEVILECVNIQCLKYEVSKPAVHFIINLFVEGGQKDKKEMNATKIIPNTLKNIYTIQEPTPIR